MARSVPGLLDYLTKRLGSCRGKGPEYEFYCPFCIDREGDESRHRKLWINVEKGKAYCFRCEYGAHTLARFFRDLNGGSLKLVELALIRGEQTPPTTSVKDAVRETLFAGLKDEPDLKPHPLPKEAQRVTQRHSSTLFRRGVNYLKRRGVPPALWKKFDIHFAPTGRYAQRLVFPVYQNGEQVYFTTRYTGDHPRKSLNPENEEGFYRRTDCLLNFDNVIGASRVAIVEGPFDCMAFPYAVALLGKTLGDRQMSLVEALVEHGTEEFVVALDSGAARDADAIYRDLLGRVPKVSVLSLDEGDPDERKKELSKLLEGRGEPSTRARVRGRLKHG